VRGSFPITVVAIVAGLAGCTSPRTTGADGSSDAAATSSAGSRPPGDGSPDGRLRAALREAIRDAPPRQAARGPALDADTLGLPTTKGPPHVEGTTLSVSRGALDNNGAALAAVPRPELLACYESALAESPGLRGKVDVAFTITASGKTKDVLVRGEIDSATLKACLTKIFSTRVFPKATSGTPYAVFTARFDPPRIVPKADWPWEQWAAPLKADPRGLPPDPEAGAPIVFVGPSEVLLDGKKVDEPRVRDGDGRLRDLAGLASALATARMRWAFDHGGHAFPGVVGLRVDTDHHALAVESAFESITHAGCSGVLVQSSTRPDRIVELSALAPRSPPPPSAGERAPVLHVVAALDEVSAAWQRGGTVLSRASLRASAPTFAADLCALWKKEGRHQDPSDRAQDAAFVRADPQLSSAQLQEVFTTINTCTRPRADGAPMPAMWITFSAI
jgi:hypothetical protein